MTQAHADTTLTDSAARLRMAVVRTARRLRQEAAGAVGELTPSELAEIERVKRPTATRTLRVLCDAGLVERTPDPADGRSALVSITSEGRERLRRLRGRKNAYLARRMRDLPSADIETLERAAAILEEILEAPRPSRRERLQ